ncbi:MAG TPA: hypothetical protein VMH84_08700 [Xanthobacteraceae bacterium]|nr:hypothetical protein [Xanthobacteraceae bacterium]
MRFLTQLSRRERTALVICLGFIAATFLVSYAEQTSIFYYGRFRDPEFQKRQYTGTIVIPEQNLGQCRFTQFNNKTSEFTRSEVGDCYSRPDVNQFDRMHSLRDAFKK